MHRIDNATAAAVVPAPAAVGTPGYFTNGNPVSGTPATVVDADWLTAVQEEIVAVIVAAGTSLSKTDRGQMLTALGLLFGGGGSLGTNGWQRLPGGLILQWGVATTSGAGNVSVTFPLTFPNASWGVTLGANVTAAEFHTAQTVGNSGFFLQSWDAAAPGSPAPTKTAFWHALGR